MKKIISQLSLITMVILLSLGFSYGARGENGWEPDNYGEPEQPIVIPYSPENSDSPEAQELQKEKEEFEKRCPEGCCGIRLNTDFPIIGKCIEISSGSKTDVTNAFPYMVGAITKIVMSLIMVVCFIFIIYAGIRRSSDDPKEAKEILKKVAITILLLGFSGVILKLINPNFFG